MTIYIGKKINLNMLIDILNMIHPTENVMIKPMDEIAVPAKPLPEVSADKIFQQSNF